MPTQNSDDTLFAVGNVAFGTDLFVLDQRLLRCSDNLPKITQFPFPARGRAFAPALAGRLLARSLARLVFVPG